MEEGIRDALSYIESHLTEDLEIRRIAAQAYVSPFHFQRIFSALCGFTVGEYIRCRRLSEAAGTVMHSDMRLIDIALLYGYESQDSFTRAFRKFHGVSPAAARNGGVNLRTFAPLRIKFTLEGGFMMEYRIVEKPAFTLVGYGRRFRYESSYTEIPKYWGEHMQSPMAKEIMGMYGLCLDEYGADDFEYLIADNYMPQKDEIPAGCKAHTLPAGLWAVFPCRGPIVPTLEATNKRIYDEWLPNNRDYCLAGNVNLEVYLEPPHEDPADDYCEIWIPVVRKDA
ncbi:MAG: AraC family transcriptional regulator [Oscillospiraceae bacterium]|nr:AraC family transcriptional regulator [Oscillospiraceae bacterium]